MNLGGTLKLISWNQKDSYRSLEKVLAVPAEEWKKELEEAAIDNYVIVSTCNRFEIYYYSENNPGIFSDKENSKMYSDSEVVAHLFRVTAGLDSMSVGENEILHQIKESFDDALKEGHVRDPLAFIFRKAISSGKLVRKDTRISRGKVSIPALSVDLIKRKYGIKGKKVTIVGAGKMASDILKYINKENPGSISIVGRTSERAAALARGVSAEWKNFSKLGEEVSNSDIIVTATASREIIISRNMVPGHTGKKIFLDISNPRNVEEPLDENYDLIDLASLSEILEENRSSKKAEIAEAEKITLSQTEATLSILGRLEIEKIIGEIYRKAESVRKGEIAKLEHEISAGVDLDEAIEAMTSALVKKLLAAQTEMIRNIHGARVTEDIKSALHNAFSGQITDTFSEEPQDLQENRNQRGRTLR